ncbi:probable inactive tRNA-specific adenosine deaminase-like protein 3 [Hylaeus anthracinus]|uniref:probable inactive tRNA-specific adenosine deaminase-like protein 3 n=1 Tax=Hylaeus anthracinus TaxID=313031 RepID=UPI0023BA378D|nr:probable inactive tRNA-specific adenosine deaminase-like protein 3 [Hylaeus anthracinus]
MVTTSPKRAKESKSETVARSWTARPILSSDYIDDPPLEEVYVGVLKRKQDISTAIKTVSSILPGFGHLKRCSSNKLLLAPLISSEQSPKTEDPSSTEKALTQNELKSLLKTNGFDLTLLEDDLQIVKVPSRTAKTKSQAARVSKIWPLNFHPDPAIESLIDGSIFTQHQLDLVERYMHVAVEAARLGAVGNNDCNGSAVIVDPEDGRILAIAASQIDQHPIWHAAMLAVDLVAELQGGGAWKSQKELEESTARQETSINENDDGSYVAREKMIKRKYAEDAPLRYPKSLSEISLPKEETLKSITTRRGRGNNRSKAENSEKSKPVDTEKCGPYLCTGYWTFLLKEPCPLCAMALVHSRVARIFYGVPNQITGVLGSRTVLHAVPGLNHRYQVWGGVLEQECRLVLQEVEHRNMD